MFDRKKLKGYMLLRGVEMEDLAKALGINVVTLYNKIRDDGRFTRAEISTMIKVLQIENPDEIFFASELTETQETEATNEE